MLHHVSYFCTKLGVGLVFYSEEAIEDLGCPLFSKFCLISVLEDKEGRFLLELVQYIKNSRADNIFLHRTGQIKSPGDLFFKMS